MPKLKHILTFPQPPVYVAPEGEEENESEEAPPPADPFFRFTFDGQEIALPPVTEIVQSIGYMRRIRGLSTESDLHTFIIFALAVEDDESILRKLDYLENEQWVDLMEKWGKFTGASLGE